MCAYLPNDLRAPFTVAVPAATTARRGSAVPDATALVIGPGLGNTSATRALVRRVLAGARAP